MEQPRTTCGFSEAVRGISLITILIGLASIPAMAAPNCATLANGLPGKDGIKSASSVLVQAAGRNMAYCQVDLLYGTNPNQNINIRVGLPLSSADGGSGGVQGAWNGRTEGLGGGGCSGNLNVMMAVNAGYVGSGTDIWYMGLFQRLRDWLTVRSDATE